MIRTALVSSEPAALQRLSALAPLDPVAIAAIHRALGQTAMIRPRRDVVTEGTPISGPRMIVSGWAARIRLLGDGRRQILNFLLPGDLIGVCNQRAPLAVSTVTAVTEVGVCPLPSPSEMPALGEAYAMSLALEGAYLLDQIARLGRLSAQERIYSLLLEIHERLQLNGMARDGAFDVPLTQEMLADALGLTSVHVNRMLQIARREGDLHWRGRRVKLLNPTVLARQIGRNPPSVSATQMRIG